VINYYKINLNIYIV